MSEPQGENHDLSEQELRLLDEVWEEIRTENDRPPEEHRPEKLSTTRSYRVACLRLTLVLLAVWFVVSFGCSILFRNWLDANMFRIGNAPFGFWMAQQGSIICFVLILIAYALFMYRLDSRHGYTK